MLHDLAIERAMLNRMQSNDDPVLSCVELEDFYDPTHAELCSCIRSSFDLDGNIRIGLVEEKMTKLKGYQWLNLLNTPYLGAPHQLFRRLRELRARREAKNFKSTKDGEEIPSEFQKKGEEIQEMLNIRQEDNTVLIERLVTGTPKVGTGFQGFDHLCSGGIENGGILVIGSMPGVGKTALAVNIANNVIQEDGRVCFVTLEMPEEALALRFLQCFWGRSRQEIRDNIRDVTEPLKNFHVKTFGNDIFKITSGMSSFLDCDLFIIDYFDLIDMKTKENHTQKLELISHELKNFAFRSRKPLIVLSQLSKDLEKSSGNRQPILADLHGTSALAKDAHVVSFLWDKNAKNREERNSSSDNEKREALGKAVLETNQDIRWIVKKNRNGILGTVMMDFNADIMRFSEKLDTTFCL